MIFPKSYDTGSVNELCFSCRKCTDYRLCTWANPRKPELPEGCVAVPTKNAVFSSYRILRCPNYESDGGMKLTMHQYDESIKDLAVNLYEELCTVRKHFDRRSRKSGELLRKCEKALRGVEGSEALLQEIRVELELRLVGGPVSEEESDDGAV